MLESLDADFKQVWLTFKILMYGREGLQYIWAIKSDGNPKMN